MKTFTHFMEGLSSSDIYFYRDKDEFIYKELSHIWNKIPFREHHANKLKPLSSLNLNLKLYSTGTTSTALFYSFAAFRNLVDTRKFSLTSTKNSDFVLIYNEHSTENINLFASSLADKQKIIRGNAAYISIDSLKTLA